MAGLVLVLGLQGPAIAAPPPPGDVSPRECLNQWDGNGNYVGEGWVGARAKVVRDVLDREVFLGCGDELSGVIHIAHPDSTGTVHPIPPGQEGDFLRCFERTIRSATISDDQGRRKYEFDWQKSNLGNADVPVQVMRSTAIVADNHQPNFVYTFYTTDDGGVSTPQDPRRTNYWPECAVSPPL